MDGYDRTILTKTYPNSAFRGFCPFGDNVGCCVEDTPLSNCRCANPPDPYENFASLDNFANLDSFVNSNNFVNSDSFPNSDSFANADNFASWEYFEDFDG